MDKGNPRDTCERERVMVILIVLAFIFIAVTLYCCLVVSSRADERMEKWEKENERETD